MPRGSSTERALSRGAPPVPEVLSKFKHVPGSPKMVAVWKLDEAERDGLITDHIIQRNLVWSPQMKEDFAEALRKGCPIPGAIILVTSDERETDLLLGQRIDGKQRSTTIREYRNGGMSEYYRALSGEDKRRFDDNEFTVWKLLYTGLGTEKAHWVAQLFRVVNTIGIRLSFGELVHAEIEPYRSGFTEIIDHRLWRLADPLTKVNLTRMDQYVSILQSVRAVTSDFCASQTKADIQETIRAIQEHRIAGDGPHVAKVRWLYDWIASGLDRHPEARKHLGIVDFPALLYFKRSIEDRHERLEANGEIVRDMVLAIDKRWRVGLDCPCRAEETCRHKRRWGIRQLIGKDVRTGNSEYFLRYVRHLRAWFDAHP